MGIKVLSLFDGIACARVALERAGIPVEEYYSSEIDKYAETIAHHNWPDITSLRDIKNFRYEKGFFVDKVGLKINAGKIDLMIGGSPCQDLSIAKTNRKGLAGERSGLFYEYLRLLKEVRPKYFILENVASMPKEAKETITKELGVEPILINAALVSAQNRKRLFWTNIPGVCQPVDRQIFLKDILEEDVGEEYYVTGKTLESIKNWNNAQAGRIRNTDGKSVTLQAGGGGTGAKTGLYIVQRARGKNNGNKHFEKSPTLTSNAFAQNNHVVALTETRTEKAKELRKAHMKKYGEDFSPRREKELVPRKDEKANTITTGQSRESLILENQSVRKLTPTECERLQGVPDGYTYAGGVSNTQRYKALGNAFNVDVIAHILSFLPKNYYN